ncbi:MAG: HAMP domain-containing histidine kinase [Lachnospiraceae bacterium]|nr:HAMP domain-containing histidine kinase [Lachnospiraceae bacterium]
MKELRKKTKWTLIAILSMILLVVLVLMNVRAYQREREDIRRSLGMLDNRMRPGNPGSNPVMGGTERPPVPGDRTGSQDPAGKPWDMENLMILDHELYIVELQDGAISEIRCLGEASEDFDINAAAAEILAKEKRDGMHAENLYTGGYAYQYRHMDSIVILNLRETAKKLWELIGETFILFVLMEALIVFVAGRITAWITRPAEEAFARQKEFIADASHELKTPLAVIMASADEMQVQEENRKYLENIRYESERMSRLIAGLLKLSKLESGEDTAAYKEENLSRILEKTCLAYEGVAFERNVAVDTDIEEPILFQCNREEIEQMASTILDNAVRHSDPDTTVRMIAKSRKDSISIQVINTGAPIPAEEEEKIFQRFYRGDKARSREENRYGLGLAIARRIARNHNGDITAHSEGGETVFHIVLRKG